MAHKPWGGRFEGETEKSVEDFTTSLSFDRRLARQDIAGSIAHARMLAKQGIISPAEGEQIVAGLTEILREIEAGEFEFDPALEDIHMAIEARLTSRLGEVGKKLHTARSRNDQVALDVRLYLAEAVEGLIATWATCAWPGCAWRICTKTPSCPATPICSGLNRSCSPTTSWPMTRCGAGTRSACRNP